MYDWYSPTISVRYDLGTVYKHGPEGVQQCQKCQHLRFL